MVHFALYYSGYFSKFSGELIREGDDKMTKLIRRYEPLRVPSRSML